MITNPLESTPENWEIKLRLRTKERAKEYLRDFALDYITPEMLHASDLYADYRSGTLGIEQARQDYGMLSAKEFKQTWGIATDFPVVKQYLGHNTWHAPENENRWEHIAPITDFDGVIGLAEDTNHETVLTHALYNLAVMDIYDGQSDIVYDTIVESESVFAPLCEVIHFDGPAMALNSKAECIRLRNSGLGHFVNESERIALVYQDEHGDSGPRFHHFASGVLNELTGTSNLRPVLGTDSKHGIVLEEGYNQERGLREIARLKTVGARARKLYLYLRKHIEDRATDPGEDDGDDTPILETNMDDVGITCVAKDDNHLAAEYISAIKNMLQSEKITPWEAPSRDKAFHIRGSKVFVDTIRTALLEQFDEDLFEFPPYDDTGYHVAKMTGYYEDEAGCVPFEVQFLTQEGRKDSRIGRAAHFFYKIMRKLGQRYIPSQEQMARLAKINKRHEHLGTDGLCPPSERRFANFKKYLGKFFEQ